MKASTTKPMTRLLRLLDQLEQAKIAYRLEHVRDSILIAAAVPGERWEIEVLQDGEVEIERFTSTGVADGEGLLERLLATHRSDATEAAVPTTNGAVSNGTRRGGPSSKRPTGAHEP